MKLFSANTKIILVLLISSSFVLFLNLIASSSRSLEIAVVIPIGILLFGFYRITRKKTQLVFSAFEKFLYLFWGSLFVQLIVIATGDFQSPFLVLIHLCMILFSFILDFPLALIFLLLSFLVIFANIALHNNLVTILLQDPNTIILQIISLIAVIPLAYILSKQYHIRDVIFSALQRKIATEDAILQQLDDLIIVTDMNFHIISVNDAVERTLQRSRSEILNKELFKTLLLRDQNNKLVTNNTFAHPDAGKHIHECTLVGTPVQHRRVLIHVQHIDDEQSHVHQLSFIITPVEKFSTYDYKITGTIEKARTKYEALRQHILNELHMGNLEPIKKQLILLEKIEDDIYTTQRELEDLHNMRKSLIDISQLCKQSVNIKQNFAQIFNIPLSFQIENFGEEDIRPLTVENFPVEPDQLTGPFFTVACDIKQLELIIQKLLDIAILLASTEASPHVNVKIRRSGAYTVQIDIKATCPILAHNWFHDIFQPYFGKLYNSTNLHLGSGLEGFLIKTVLNAHVLPLDLNITRDSVIPGDISFLLTLEKTIPVE